MIKIVKIKEQIIELIESDEPDWINKYRREAADKWYHLLGEDDWVRVWSYEMFEEAYQRWRRKQNPKK